MINATEVVHIPIESIDLDDRSFMFRASLRTADLEESIAAEGQQIPIIVRPTVDGSGYQIVSGFRRALAMRELGSERIAAIVRHDLDDDEAAFRASIIENERRQTYSDIDRALAIIRYEQAGWSSVEVTDLMGLKRSQKYNLERLLSLPEPVVAAIDDPRDHCSATHGLVLGQLLQRYPELDLEHWLEVIDREQLSVTQLRRAIHKVHKVAGQPRLGSIYNERATDKSKGVFRLDAVKVVIAELDKQERDQLRGELTELIKALDGAE
jgi:ParB/RepB/Spo0J family partition protein